ncbi:MAG: hypothetical protein LBC80_01070 [Treponema sp.]|jgi:hypothetical protein|nr:hypothetical protein [Treponema sp.]
MKKIKLLLVFVFLLIFSHITLADAMFSPTWGFFVDLPQGYYFEDGDGRDRFSFSGPEDLMFDLVIYNGQFNTMLDLVEDVNRRLQNQGDVDFFVYNDRQAAVIKLTFANYDGWGFAVELDAQSGARQGVLPMLIALSYSPVNSGDLSLFHLSALDSIAPSIAERFYPGPITEYSYPRGEAQYVALVLDGVYAWIHENDAEAAQVMIEREFAVLRAYLNTAYLYDAFIRYYRFIYRDSFARINDAVSVTMNYFNGHRNLNDVEKRVFAQRVLSFIQGFEYERDLSGSDFINLVTTIVEGRGSCDNFSMLFAMILNNADIRSAMMLSPYYGHAMGLVDITGSGARFDDPYGTRWLVAETTAKIDIGLIAQDESDPQHWFVILLE